MIDLAISHIFCAVTLVGQFFLCRGFLSAVPLVGHHTFVGPQQIPGRRTYEHRTCEQSDLLAV